MKKLTIFLTILFCFVAVVDTSAKTRKRTKKRARTTRVVKKKRVVPPTIHLKATEGGDRIDSQYERNIDLAHRFGLKVGSYHFFRPKADLQLQLENFKTQCLPGEQDLIPMLDVETTGNLSTEEFCDSLHKFLDMLEETYHQKPLVYTFRNFYNKHLVGELDDYQLMVAMYADDPPVLADNRDYTIWQYTCKGRILGVSGMVDKSCLMGGHTLQDLKFIH